MPLKNANKERLGPPLAKPLIGLCLLAALAAPARAQDSAIAREITTTFDTVVTATAKAAKKAANAASQALAEEKPRRKKKKAAEPSDDAQSAAAGDAAKGEQPKNGKEAEAKGAKPEGKDAAAAKSDAKPAETKPDSNKPDVKQAPDSKQAEDPAKKDGAKDAKAADAAKKQPPTEWPAADVELAKARCTQLLKGVEAVTIPEAPFRKGDCGSMAPVRLVSIGKNPEVSLSPPPVVSCDLVVALAKWVKEDVQPAAKRHLGAEVIRMESMSDYSCRMAYGRIGNKLSEHGKANALDIRGFITSKGNQAIVLTGWGETKRDIKKQIAEAKAAAAKAEAVKVAAEDAAKQRAAEAEYAAKSEITGTSLPRKTLVEGLPPRKGDAPALALPAAMVKEGTFDKAVRLGGPKNAVATSEDTKHDGKKRKDAKGASKTGKEKGDTVAALPPAGDDAEIEAPQPTTPASRFLHETHAAACKIFGTTLGPEANEAHRNHFHVDMAERKVRKICD
jgi:hypothetical protein